MKYYIIQNDFWLKTHLFMLLDNFVFVVSHLKIHLAANLNTLKALMLL